MTCCLIGAADAILHLIGCVNPIWHLIGSQSIIAPRRKGETKEEKKRRKAEAKARARVCTGSHFFNVNLSIDSAPSEIICTRFNAYTNANTYLNNRLFSHFSQDRRAEKKMNKLSFKAEKKRFTKAAASASQYRTKFKY